MEHQASGPKSERPKIWIIAGTSEGRMLARELKRYALFLYVSVATQYGKELIEGGDNLEVISRRLDDTAMTAFIAERQIDGVIDATHPYAREVTANIIAACTATGTRYWRLLRPASAAGGLIYAGDYAQAAEMLAATTGRIFLTTGSKAMEAFCTMPDYRERIYARVLPMPEVIQKCNDLGFNPSHIIAMQGPFSKELNLAMFKACGAEIMVTKDSGEAGGFREKVEAALELGLKVVVIGRPPEKSGYSFNEIIEKVKAGFHLGGTDSAEAVMNPKEASGNPDVTPYFPLFVPLRDKTVKIFGGGVIAARRIHTLRQFGGALEVIAPEISDEISGLDGIRLTQRCYRPGDCAAADLIVAATDNAQVNRMIAEECRERNIPVSVADDKTLCTFYFPAVIVQDEMVIAVTASGQDHGRVKRAAERIRRKLKELVD